MHGIDSADTVDGGAFCAAVGIYYKRFGFGTLQVGEPQDAGERRAALEKQLRFSAFCCHLFGFRQALKRRRLARACIVVATRL